MYILDLGTSRRWLVSVMSRPFYPQYALDRKLGGPESERNNDRMDIQLEWERNSGEKRKEMRYVMNKARRNDDGGSGFKLKERQIGGRMRVMIG